MLSRKFMDALKASPMPRYRLAREADVHPTVLWKLVCGYQEPRNGDERLLRVGKLLGLKRDEVFEVDEDE